MQGIHGLTAKNLGFPTPTNSNLSTSRPLEQEIIKYICDELQISYLFWLKNCDNIEGEIRKTLIDKGNLLLKTDSLPESKKHSLLEETLAELIKYTETWQEEKKN